MAFSVKNLSTLNPRLVRKTGTPPPPCSHAVEVDLIVAKTVAARVDRFRLSANCGLHSGDKLTRAVGLSKDEQVQE
jgi:hypothetical protein